MRFDVKYLLITFEARRPRLSYIQKYLITRQLLPKDPSGVDVLFHVKDSLQPTEVPFRK